MGGEILGERESGHTRLDNSYAPLAASHTAITRDNYHSVIIQHLDERKLTIQVSVSLFNSVLTLQMTSTAASGGLRVPAPASVRGLVP